MNGIACPVKKKKRKDTDVRPTAAKKKKKKEKMKSYIISHEIQHMMDGLLPQ